MTENEVLKDLQNYQGILKAKTRINVGANAEIALDAITEAIDVIQSYREIGTIDEFKALKEKNTIIKVIDIRKSECPEDIEYFGSDELFGKCPHCEGMVNHTWNPCSCGDCGGLIDWSE